MVIIAFINDLWFIELSCGVIRIYNPYKIDELQHKYSKECGHIIYIILFIYILLFIYIIIILL